MDFWPSDRRPLPANAYSRRRRKKKHTDVAFAEAPYPLAVHGSLGAVQLRDRDRAEGKGVEWTTMVQEGYNEQKLHTVGKRTIIFPPTRAPLFELADRPPIKRVEEADAMIKLYYPTTPIPFDILRDEMTQDEQILRNHPVFDPFPGNRLAYMDLFVEDDEEGAPALVFPMGETGANFHVVPFARHRKTGALTFVPDNVPLELMLSPIMQIASTSARDPWIFVRTRAQVSALNIHAFYTDKSDSEFDRPELETRHCIRIDNADLDKRQLVDLASSPYATDGALAVGSKGDVYALKASSKTPVQKYAFDLTAHDASSFRRVAYGRSAQTALVSTSTSVHILDLRSPPSSSPSIIYTTGHNQLMASIESPDTHRHLMSFCTTKELVWLDERNTARPVMGWRHNRKRERTLEARTVRVLDDAPLIALSSRESALVSLYDVDRPTPDGGLVHTFGHPTALTGGLAGRLGLALAPAPSEHDEELSMWMFELGPRGELVRTDVREGADQKKKGVGVEEEERKGVVWSQKMLKMDEKMSKRKMKPAAGAYAARDRVLVDFSALYKYLFVTQRKKARDARALRVQGDAVHRVMHIMPFYFQSADTPVDNMLTLFDLAYRSGSEPRIPARADWLTPSALDSTPGRLAFAQHGIPGAFMAQRGGVAWHWDMTPTLTALDPHFRDTGSGYYTLREGSVNAKAQRRIREDAQQLELDRALAGYVYSTRPFKKQDEEKGEGGGEAVEAGMSRLRLGKSPPPPPPPVRFGYLRPCISARFDVGKGKGKEKQQPQRRVSTRSMKKDQTQEKEPEKETKRGRDRDRDVIPLGIRLLLSEWTVGTDPNAYTFRDPYGDGDDADDLETDHEDEPLPPPKRTTGKRQPTPTPTMPPVILTASTLRREGSLPLMTTGMSMGFGSQSQGLGPSTQVVPGPFGGRPQVAKKPVKKRMGGF
ncbi:hypothetical protein EXIGLDRAFT_747149 [Exidia glandulosa HHB12029]|uniref:Uncharacterized protein n=1 Tax=Exidia glandulosa HHB12029 TaxID=1314781 RepID=A0A165L5N6_EXIGL|nr:hypothetical protein EXIGLDRAFT_747149 [Exidia glandulosa HHB12029]